MRKTRPSSPLLSVWHVSVAEPAAVAGTVGSSSSYSKLMYCSDSSSCGSSSSSNTIST